MLDGCDPRLALDQGGTQLGVTDIFGVRHDGCEFAQIRAPEQDAGVRRRRAQRHQDLLARVQTTPEARMVFFSVRWPTITVSTNVLPPGAPCAR